MIRILSLRRLQYNQQVHRFFMTIVALGFVIDGVYAVLLNLYLLRLGYDAKFIGQVNSFGLLAFASMSFPAGLLGTRWTSRQMLRAGSFCVLSGTILLPLAESSPGGWQEGWLVITYALVLMGFSLYFVNAAPFLMSAVDEERQSSAFATQTALLAFAAFAGSLLGGVLPDLIANFYGFIPDDPAPYRYTLAVAAVVTLVAFIITLTIEDEPEEDSELSIPPDEITTNHGLVNGFTLSVIMLILVMSVVRYFQVAGLATLVIYFNVYLDTQYAMSSSVIGAIASIGRLIVVPTVLFAPYLIRRTSRTAIILWASLVTALCILPIAFAPSWWIAAIAYIGAQAAANLRFAALIVYIMVIVPKRQQSVMAGAGEMAAGLSFAVMAWGGGTIIESSGFHDLFLLGAILSGLGAGIFWLHLRRQATRTAAAIGVA